VTPQGQALVGSIVTCALTIITHGVAIVTFYGKSGMLHISVYLFELLFLSQLHIMSGCWTQASQYCQDVQFKASNDLFLLCYSLAVPLHNSTR
jgi:hypothetical protein